jgi:hypothetical protein
MCVFFLARRRKVQSRHGQDESDVNRRGGGRKAHQHGTSGNFKIKLLLGFVGQSDFYV